MKVGDLVELLKRWPADRDITVCGPGFSPDFEWNESAEVYEQDGELRLVGRDP